MKPQNLANLNKSKIEAAPHAPNGTAILRKKKKKKTFTNRSTERKGKWLHMYHQFVGKARECNNNLEYVV